MSKNTLAMQSVDSCCHRLNDFSSAVATMFYCYFYCSVLEYFGIRNHPETLLLFVKTASKSSLVNQNLMDKQVV